MVSFHNVPLARQRDQHFYDCYHSENDDGLEGYFFCSFIIMSHEEGFFILLN